MRQFATRRLLILSAIATGILAAGAWLDEGSGRAMEVVVAPASARAVPQKAGNEGRLMPPGAAESWRGRRLSAGLRDPFATGSWDAPVAAAKQPSAATASALPASTATEAELPFTYVGKLVDHGHTMVFLSRQDRNYVAREGDVLDNAYRIEQIEPARITMTYLPLNTKQMMTIGVPK